MVKHRSHSIEFKRPGRSGLPGRRDVLYGLAKRHEISRTLIRVCVLAPRQGLDR
jgi:hypothetical protein